MENFNDFRNKEQFIQLVENAIDFLNQAIEDFETKPKYSVINFFSALELFLKARLLYEHWSLIVMGDADLTKFHKGDFVSVSFQNAIDRTEKIIGYKISDSTKKAFNAVRKHRNQIVHFYNNDNNKDKIASEQLSAWYDLQQLLRKGWKDVFAKWENEFVEIESKLLKYKKYLETKFNAISLEIKNLQAQGFKIFDCNSCQFKAAVQKNIIGNFKKNECLVCEYSENVFLIECEECEQLCILTADLEGFFNCTNCNHYLHKKNLKSLISDYSYHNDPDGESEVHCNNCGDPDSVVPYQNHWICVVCLELYDTVYYCEWCKSANTYYVEDSNWNGCEFCDGARGHYMYEND